ncbi:MAG: glycogen/starch synthase [Treponema sp.]|nr:glycogen/starch synthase [Treponema sp.]
MKLWIVSMECAGIAEAGGVKNVTYSLCKEFSELNHKTTLFIPVFGCNSWEHIADVEDVQSVEFELCGKKETVTYSKGFNTEGNFNVVFINHHGFSEKEDVYTYTEHESQLNPLFVKGTGHVDGLFLDVLFQRAVCEYSKVVNRSEIPDIIHCQDASAAILPAFMKEYKPLKKVQSVVTVHNAGPAYHHNFSSVGEAAWYTKLPVELLENSMNHGSVEPFLLAANSGAYISTVSEQYAEEITDPENYELTDGLSPIFFEKKINVKGITNGFDFDRYNPEDKRVSLLPFEFSPEKGEMDGKFKCRKFFIQNVVNTDNFNSKGIKKFGKLECSSDFTKETYICYHGRLTGQKGINVLIEAIPAIIENFPFVRFVLAGQGDPVFEKNIIELTQQYEGKVTFMNGYNRVVARLVSASCDFIVLPSYFEPCGLEDYIAQVYGTLPIAHKTGGLNKIVDEKTGFLYRTNKSDCLVAKISEVIMIKELKSSFITKMIKNASQTVRKEYLWKTVIQKKYLPFFKEILKNSKN